MLEIVLLRTLGAVLGGAVGFFLSWIAAPRVDACSEHLILSFVSIGAISGFVIASAVSVGRSRIQKYLLGTFDALVPFSVLILEPGSIGYGKWNAFALLNFAPLMLAGIVASFGKIFATTDRPKKGILAVVVVFALIPPGCSAVVRKAGYLCGW